MNPAEPAFSQYGRRAGIRWKAAVAPGTTCAAGLLALWINERRLDLMQAWPDEERELTAYSLKHLALGVAFAWLLAAWHRNRDGGTVTPGRASAAYPGVLTDSIWLVGSGLATLAVTFLCPTSLDGDWHPEEVFIPLVFLTLPAFALTGVAVALALQRVRHARQARRLVAVCLGIVAAGPLIATATAPWSPGGGPRDANFLRVFILGLSMPMGLAILVCLGAWASTGAERIRSPA